MRSAAIALALLGCARTDTDPPPRASGGPATIAEPTLPVWFGRPGASPERIAGMLYADGAPIAGTVHLRMEAPDPTVWKGRDVEVHADGAFDFGEVRAGRYRIFATASGKTSRVVDITAGEPANIHLYPCTKIERVVRAARRPLEGAAIDVGGVVIAATDRTGKFTACAGKEPLVATIRAGGYGAMATTIDRAGDASIGINVSMGVTIEGDVTERNGKRAEGVAVQVIDRAGVPVPVQAMTDSDGRFTLHDIPEDGARFEFRVIDGEASSIDRTTSWEVGSEQVPHVNLDYATTDAKPGSIATLTGMVVHAGKPLPDAEVRIGTYATRTRMDGGYTLGYVPAPGSIVTITHPTGLATARAIAIDASAITFSLEEIGTIAGTVVDATGDPIRCRIRVRARDTAVDRVIVPGANGHFSFDAELGETYDIVAEDARMRAAKLEVALDASVPNITGLQVMIR